MDPIEISGTCFVAWWRPNTLDYTYFWVFSSSIPRENGGGLGMGSNLQNTEEYNINVLYFRFLFKDIMQILWSIHACIVHVVYQI